MTLCSCGHADAAHDGYRYGAMKFSGKCNARVREAIEVDGVLKLIERRCDCLVHMGEDANSARLKIHTVGTS